MSRPPRKPVSVGFLLVAGLILALLAAVAIPNFVRARFDSSGEPLSLRVTVEDQETGLPVPGAAVRIPNMTAPDGQTDAGGQCDVVARFRATGRMGEGGKPASGVLHLFGTMRVQAPGYAAWEKPFPDLLGARYDYVTKGSTVTQVVKLQRQAGSGPR